MGRKQTHQPTLFDHYGWKSVQQATRNDILVEAGRLVKILEVKIDNGIWILRFTNGETNEKSEQWYSAHDFIYGKMPLA
jgi:hypothetical protein